MDEYNKVYIDFITLREGILNISGYLLSENAGAGVKFIINFV